MWAWVGRLARSGAVTASGGGRGFSRRARSHRHTFPFRIGAGPLGSPGLGEVVEALQMNPKHFKERYSHNMPSKADCLVFSCLAGVRSNQALVAAKSLGFSRAQHYAGGFKEWTEFESSEEK